MPMAIRNTSASTTPTTTGHSLPLLCFFFFDPPRSPPLASSAGAGWAGGTYCVASSLAEIKAEPLQVSECRTYPIVPLQVPGLSSGKLALKDNTNLYEISDEVNEVDRLLAACNTLANARQSKYRAERLAATIAANAHRFLRIMQHLCL